MLLTMATAMGFSGLSADARASRILATDAVTTAPAALPTLAALDTATTRVGDGEWRYVPSRR